MSAIENTEVDKIKVLSGNYGSSDEYDNLVIKRPITIKGSGEERPIIFGSIVVLLEDDEINPVKIENLEISHSGLYVPSDTNNQKDGRRGIKVLNGSVEVKNNYIHLTNQNPETKLITAPTGIQLSVSSTSSKEKKDMLSYVIEGNKIGKYSRSQTSASSDPTALVGEYNINKEINIDRNWIDNFYNQNTFEDGTDCYGCVFNYQTNKYTAGIFSSEQVVKTFAGNSYQYVDSSLEVKQVGDVWKLVEKQ